MTPIFTSFFTRGTLYEAEAARLHGTLRKFDLASEMVGIDSRGDWSANTRYTAMHICNMLEKFPLRPVVYLDADAFVHRMPDLFFKTTADVAVYYLPRGEHRQLCNGTAYFAPNENARMVARLYREIVEEGLNPSDEQKNLDVALFRALAIDPKLKIEYLPGSYCFIHDINAHDLKGEIVIEHLQASRERSPGSAAVTNRQKRIKQVEALAK